ncbi:MAG: dUTP diphosphatase [Acholeplasmataceae bacterium]|nr:dUTP diphosphatase [Acholeplasmataceae bacterium]
MRGFEKVSKEEYGKYGIFFDDIIIPKRATANSAGYDFYLPCEMRIEPGQVLRIATGIKAYMESDEVLLLFVRSSVGFSGLRLKNQVGVIDSDYYNNPKNEGHILIVLENTDSEVFTLKKGDRFVQGIFLKYLLSENEEKPKDERIGGLGSTTK